jgi:hypothetical protein
MRLVGWRSDERKRLKGVRKFAHPCAEEPERFHLVFGQKKGRANLHDLVATTKGIWAGDRRHVR